MDDINQSKGVNLRLSTADHQKMLKDDYTKDIVIAYRNMDGQVEIMTYSNDPQSLVDELQSKLRRHYG